MKEITENKDFLKFVAKRRLSGYLIVSSNLFLFFTFILMLIFFPNFVALEVLDSFTFGLVFLFTLIIYSILSSLHYYRIADQFDQEQEKFKQSYLLELNSDKQFNASDVT